jgi:murein DD-endopeptidase MepM/ murein hydrolase activator NlpD
VTQTIPPPRAPDPGRQFAEVLSTLGAQRFGGHFLLLIVALSAIGLGQANLLSLVPASLDVRQLAAAGGPAATGMPAPDFVLVGAPPAASLPAALTRLTDIHTYIPEQSRGQTINTYTVEKGDTILGIAEKFGLKPETIVFGNPILKDNPHYLEPGQTLRIAPVDGLIRDVIPGDTIAGLARAYGVKPEAITGWVANKLDPDNPQIAPGQVLFVPGGSRGLLNVFAPDTSGATANAGGARGGGAAQPKSPPVLRSGIGQCPGGNPGGVTGSGSFVFPTGHHYVSGYNFSGVHPGIDLSADTGDPIYAADNGVVVFAGWSDWGYGNTVIIDHGNNWWTLYAHLSQILVACGQGVYQGNPIGASGATGRAQGAHLHFEIYYGVYQTNPWGVLPAP